MKIKHIMPVFVTLLFLGLANTAFAQLSCNVASTPVSRDTATGLTEPAGDITFSCTQTGATASTAGATITVDYQGTPITNSTAYPAGKPISVTPITPIAGCTQPTIGATGVSNATGQVVITVPALSPGVGTSCSFTLTGVLLGLAGTGKTSVVATVSVSPGNNLLITAGQNTPTVVTSVLPGIVPADVAAPTTPALVLTSGTVLTATSTAITVRENYIDMFRSAAQFNGGFSTQGVQLLFTFSGIPSGATVSCTAPTLNNAAVPGQLVLATGVATAAAPTIIVEITSANLNTQDTLSLPCTFAIGTTAIPLTPGTITATVTLAPTGNAFSAGGAVLTAATTGQIPRYTANAIPVGVVVNIISATTHMLIPYATIQPGYDTGLVVANTSRDPYGFTVAAGGARPIGGAASVIFFPTAGGSPFCIATGPGAPGTSGGQSIAGITGCSVMSLTGRGTLGLGTGGTIAAGSSWAVLGSELLGQIGSSAPSSFIGYIFIIANFPFAHPTAYVVDAAFSGKFTSGGPALVLPNPAVASRTAGLGAGLVESLGH